MHEGSSVLWHLRAVLVWLQQRDYEIDPKLIEVAATAMQVNLAKSASLAVPAMKRELRALLA